MAEKGSNKSSDESDDMDCGEGEGAAVPVRSIATQSAPHSPAVSASAENSEVPVISSRNASGKRRQTEKLVRSVIPVLNKDTVSSDTYDPDMLLNKKLQQQVFSGHRMKSSRTPDIPKLLNTRSLNISIENERYSTPKHHHGSFDNRSEELKKGIEKRFGKLKDDIKSKEILECFFIPNHEKLKAMLPTSPKTIGERLSSPSQKKFKHAQKKQEESSFRPEICEKSKKIDEKNPSTEPRYEKLHKNYKVKSSKELAQAKVNNEEIVRTTITILEPEPQEPFHPVLNQRSKNLIRTVPFEENYALHRQNSANHAIPINLCTSPRSEKVLIDMFTREFNELIDPDTEEISYSHLMEVLRGLYFLLENEKNAEGEKEIAIKLWEQLEENDRVNKDRLLMFLMAIMRYKPHLLYKNRQNLIAPEESDRIHKKYAMLYQNRVSVKNKSNVNKTFKHTYDFSFKPEINENYKSMFESQSSDTLKVEDRLMEKMLLNSIKIEKLKDQHVKGKESECTFKPQLLSKFKKSSEKKETNKETIAKEYLNLVNGIPDRNEALYSLASVKKEKFKKSISFKEQKSSEESLQFPFSPRTIKMPKEALSPKVVGSDKTVERLSRAREDKLVQQVAAEKGFPFQGQKKLPKTSIEGKDKPQKITESKNKNPEKEKKFKEWEQKKLKEMKMQKDREKQKQELIEKQNLEAQQQKIQELEEKRKQRLEKIQTSKEKQLKDKKKDNRSTRPFFFHVQSKEDRENNEEDKQVILDDKPDSSQEEGLFNNEVANVSEKPVNSTDGFDISEISEIPPQVNSEEISKEEKINQDDNLKIEKPSQVKEIENYPIVTEGQFSVINNEEEPKNVVYTEEESKSMVNAEEESKNVVNIEEEPKNVVNAEEEPKNVVNLEEEPKNMVNIEDEAKAVDASEIAAKEPVPEEVKVEESPSNQ